MQFKISWLNLAPFFISTLQQKNTEIFVIQSCSIPNLQKKTILLHITKNLHNNYFLKSFFSLCQMTITKLYNVIYFYSDFIQGCLFLEHGHQKNEWQFPWISKKWFWLSTKGILVPCHTGCFSSLSWWKSSWMKSRAIWKFPIDPIVQAGLFSKFLLATTKPKINDENVLFLKMKIQRVTIKNDIYLPC